MGIEFKYLSKKSEPSIVLSNNEFNKLFPFFDQLNRQVGVFIDEYSDSKLSPSHIKILLDFLEKETNFSTESSNIKNLIQLFKKASKDSEWIQIIGD